MSEARFFIGQRISHRLFDYRGVIIDVDACFMGTDEWYAEVAQSRPPKDAPWYHVLVHDTDSQTYVAERNLEPDVSNLPVNHPWLDQVFSGFEHGAYQPIHRAN